MRWPSLEFVGSRSFVLASLLLVGHPAAAAASNQGRSLEDYLRKLRRSSDEELAPLRGKVEAIIADMERLGQASDSALRPVRRRLTQLGPAVAPLLVPWLEPETQANPSMESDGTSPTRSNKVSPQLVRSRHVASVLRGLAAPSVTDRLLELARNGTLEGRCNALTALGGSPEPEHVGAALREIYAGESGRVRHHALRALASLPGPRDVFVDALSLNDEELAEVALEALTGDSDHTLTAPVIAFLRGPRGARHVRAILAYLKAAPAPLDDSSLEALIATLLGNALGAGDKADLLDTLAALEVHMDSATKRALDPLTRSPSSEVSESALILLARQRDSKARRRLLEPYDAAVDRSKGSPSVYSRRAYVLYRMRDLRAAIKDYKRALEQGRGNTIDEVPLLGLARCYALQGKFKDAADYLARAPISLATLRELAADPDFAEMAEDRVGRDAFPAPEDDS